MSKCPKCGVANEDGLTRCRACNAILPVKLGSESAVRYERVPKKAESTGLPCPSCGALNPYTRFRCDGCGASLTQHKRDGLRERLWVYLGAAVLILILGLVLFRTL